MANRPGFTAREWITPTLLTGAALIAYHNTFAVPFLLDDHVSIVENLTIRRLGALGEVFAPPVADGTTVAGRPFLNFTFALNHAISGNAVWSYHAVNLLIHVLAALTLFGVLRRTLALSNVAQPFASWLPLGVSLLWLLHPLQTQAVTYIAQRAESLASLFYLLTLYAFIRGVEAGGAVPWRVFSVGACLLGLMTKEIVATAPVLVFLFDRTFVARSFREAWRARRGYYLALASTWLVLAWLVAGAGARGGSVGANETITAWNYALTQAGAIVHYLRLVFWPSPLVFDYGTPVVTDVIQAVPPLLLLSAVLAAAVVALRRHPVLGFLSASFFIVLAPSSSVVPITTQTISEHRIYLALAPVLIVVCLMARRLPARTAMIGAAGLAIAAGSLTIGRNADYRTEYSLWQDTALKRPDNPRAQNEHGRNLLLAGRVAEALPFFAQAVRLRPGSADYRFNLALSLERLGRPTDARSEYEVVVRLRPDDPESWQRLGACQAATGDHDAAIAVFRRGLDLKPDEATLLFHLAESCFATHRYAEAADYYGRALQQAPGNAAWHHFRGLAFALSGRIADAAAEFERALELRPDYAEARTALARARSQLGAPGLPR